MKLKSIIVAAALVTGALASTAQASPVWTITVHGTIYEGTDVTGWFGLAGKSLKGLTYTQTITVSVDPNQYNYHYSGGGFAEMNGVPPFFTDTVTVGGKTISFNISDHVYGDQMIKDSASFGGSDYITSHNLGYDSTHTYYVSAGGGVYTDSASKAFVPTLDFGQTINVSTGQGVYGSQSFYVETNGHASAYFSSSSDTMTFNVNDVSAVPEPTSIALLGLGLLGITALRRRKSS